MVPIDKVLADYAEAIRLDPENARAYHDRGKSLQAKGDLDRAIVAFSEASRLDREKERHSHGNAQSHGRFQFQ
jgi:tetratricopeptide (TPR) repeat protein